MKTFQPLTKKKTPNQPFQRQDRGLETYSRVDRSDQYPWIQSPAGNAEVQQPQAPPQVTNVIENETDQAFINQSVDETFISHGGLSQFKAHHYFDYMAGTSTGG